MKHLNDINGFENATGILNDKLAKVNICGEGFWVRKCRKQSNGLLTGIVDNELDYTELHGLQYKDKVTFKATAHPDGTKLKKVSRFFRR